MNVLKNGNDGLQGHLGSLLGLSRVPPMCSGGAIEPVDSRIPRNEGQASVGKLRDCEKTQNRDLFIFDGVFSDCVRWRACVTKKKWR